jgi:hypothetical protein
MTAKTKKDSAGKALYLEFRNKQYTYQVVVVPHSISLENEVIPPVFMRRRVSIWHPRRNWQITKFQGVPTPERDAYGAFSKNLSEVSSEEFVEKTYHYVAKTFDNLFSQDWKLYERPLVVEYSYEDLALLANGKTPNGLYRRIERSRKAVSWGDSIFNEVEV